MSGCYHLLSGQTGFHGIQEDCRFSGGQEEENTSAYLSFCSLTSIINDHKSAYTHVHQEVCVGFNTNTLVSAVSCNTASGHMVSSVCVCVLSFY